MEVQVRKIRLKPLQGEYAEYLRITASYHQGGSYITDYKVAHWLQIGQALGLGPPHTDNHASDGSGGAGEKLKAQEEEKNFASWKDQNAAQLANVEIESSSLPTKSREGTIEEKQAAEIRRETRRETVKKKKVDTYIQSQGCLAGKGYVAYDPIGHGPYAKTEKCPHCNQKFVNAPVA